jgi:hypothetical protein
MKLKTGIIAIFLFIGLLGVPNCIFAQQYEDSAHADVIQSNLQSTMLLNSLTPLVKGSSGGSKGSSSSSSSSKKVKDGDDVDDNSTDDSNSGWSWMTIIIILIVIFGIIGVLVWYFVLR